jgi:hypothetical protein
MYLAVIYVLAVPASTFMMPRNFTLRDRTASEKTSKPFEAAYILILVLSVAVIVGKAMVFHGMRGRFSDFMRQNDPLILLDDVEETFPFIGAIIWQFLLVSLPLFVVSGVYHFKLRIPRFLWEVALVNFALVLTNQFVFIAGSFFWRVPNELKAKPSNPAFWIINIVPLAGSAMEVAHIWHRKVTIVPNDFQSKHK